MALPRGNSLSGKNNWVDGAFVPRISDIERATYVPCEYLAPHIACNAGGACGNFRAVEVGVSTAKLASRARCESVASTVG
jgi:hypothetical protein